MKVDNLEQTETNKRSGRKRANYEKLEQEYQDVQKHWEEHNDKKSWDRMVILINLAVFNNINKKLEYILPREEIEERALEVTMKILQALLNKKKEGKEWKINKVSSAVFLPCLYIYNEKLQFEDRILGEDHFTFYDELGNPIQAEYIDSYMDRETATYHLHGKETEEQTFRTLEEAYKILEKDFSLEDINASYDLVNKYGSEWKEHTNSLQEKIIYRLGNLLKGDED